MQSKCSSNSKIFNGNHNYFINTIEIIFLTLIIFGLLYYYYVNKRYNNQYNNQYKYIDRFADTVDENKWNSYTIYNIQPTTGKIIPTSITLSDNIKNNLDTDRYLAMDSSNPTNTLASIDYSNLDLQGMNNTIKQQNNNVKNMIDTIQKIKDVEKRKGQSQINDNNDLINILSNDITQNILNQLNQQNNMAYKLLLQDNYNSTHITP